MKLKVTDCHITSNYDFKSEVQLNILQNLVDPTFWSDWIFQLSKNR